MKRDGDGEPLYVDKQLDYGSTRSLARRAARAEGRVHRRRLDAGRHVELVRRRPQIR